MPTREVDVYSESYEAAADLSAKQYFAVKLDSTANRVALAGAGVGVGILQNKPAAIGRGAEVRHLGISRHVVDGNATAIVIGSKITADSAGKGVVADTAGDIAYAEALEASTVDGDEISVLMIGPTRIHA